MRTAGLVLCLLVLLGGMFAGLRDGADAEPSALQILRRSDRVMDGMLRFYVSIEVYPPGGSEPNETYSILINNKRCAESSRGDPECSCHGGTEVPEYFDRALGGVAEVPLWSPEFMPGGTRPEKLTIVADELFRGQPVWQISYEFLVSGIEGPILIQRKEWISKENYRLLRQEDVHSEPRGIFAPRPGEGGFIRSDLTGDLGFEFPCPIGSQG